MLSSLRIKVFDYEPFVISPTVSLLVPVQVLENGNLVNRSEFQVINIAESLARFTSNDFSVNSLRSVGALDTLKSVFMSPISSMNIADSFDNLIPSGDDQTK